MANIKEIEALTNAFGPSGFEDEVIREVKNWCGGLDVANDAMYNVYATMKKKKAGRPVLMLDAHLDECGFMVQSILENGLLSILMLGGFHLTSLPAHSVIVRTREEKAQGNHHIQTSSFSDSGSEKRQLPGNRGYPGGCGCQQPGGSDGGLWNPPGRPYYAGCKL